MNNKWLIRISNFIGIVSIILLVYWVFIFITVTVFGLKVFRENITETFYLSVVGILALMLGSLIINVMLNLTRIAEKHNNDKIEISPRRNKRILMIFIITFPIILAFLLIGNYLTIHKKEQLLIKSAKSIVEGNEQNTNHLLNYRFSKEWITETDQILKIFSKTDKHFPFVSVIVLDSVRNSHVFLSFKDYYSSPSDTTLPVRTEFIYPSTDEERTYLNDVFLKNKSEIRFSAKDGNYELFYPYAKNGKKTVLYFSDYQRYGKIGS